MSWHARHPQQTLPKYKAGGHFSQNRWAIKSRKSGKPAYRQCAVPTGWVSKSCEQVGQCLPPQCCQTIAPNRTFAKSVSTVKTRKRQKPHPPELRMFKTEGSTDTWPAHGPQDCPQAAPHVVLLVIALWNAPLAELPGLAPQPWGWCSPPTALHFSKKKHVFTTTKVRYHQQLCIFSQKKIRFHKKKG